MGDIAECGSNTLDDDVAAMLANTTGVIATLGDTVYSTSSAAEYRDCFDHVDPRAMAPQIGRCRRCGLLLHEPSEGRRRGNRAQRAAD